MFRASSECGMKRFRKEQFLLSKVPKSLKYTGILVLDFHATYWTTEIKSQQRSIQQEALWRHWYKQCKHMKCFLCQMTILVAGQKLSSVAIVKDYQSEQDKNLCVPPSE